MECTLKFGLLCFQLFSRLTVPYIRSTGIPHYMCVQKVWFPFNNPNCDLEQFQFIPLALMWITCWPIESVGWKRSTVLFGCRGGMWGEIFFFQFMWFHYLWLFFGTQLSHKLRSTCIVNCQYQIFKTGTICNLF